MQMGYDFENSMLAAAAGAGLRARPEEAARAAPGSVSASGGSGTAPQALIEEPGQPALRHPDWAGLRARFAAIHALRRALASDDAVPPPTGSFAGAGESVLSACRAGTDVNPVYWVNSKGPCAITGPVAAAPHAATED